jgi:hypothetical protein
VDEESAIHRTASIGNACWSGLLQGTRTIAALFCRRDCCLLQLEVESHFGEAPFHAACARSFGILAEADFTHQPVTGGVGEVVPQVLVT